MTFQPEDGVGAFVEEEVQGGEVGGEAEAVGKDLIIRPIQSEFGKHGVRPFGVDDVPIVVLRG